MDFLSNNKGSSDLDSVKGYEQAQKSAHKVLIENLEWKDASKRLKKDLAITAYKDSSY